MKTLTLLAVVVIFIIAAPPLRTSGAEQSTQSANPKAEAATGDRSRDQTNVAAAYDASRERLQHAREALRRTADEATQGLQRQLKKAQEQLDVLGSRLEELARSAGDKTATVSRQVEEGIALRVRRMEARANLLQAKAEATLAVRAASRHDFPLAEQRLAKATEFLRRARAALAGDHAYDDQFDDMEAALQRATAAIKEQAQDARKKIEQVLTDADRIVGSLEVTEDHAVLQGK